MRLPPRPDGAFAVLSALDTENARGSRAAQRPALRGEQQEQFPAPAQQQHEAKLQESATLRSLGRALRLGALGGSALPSRVGSATVQRVRSPATRLARETGVVQTGRGVHIDRNGIITIGAAMVDANAAPRSVLPLGRYPTPAPPTRPAPAARPFDLLKAISYLEEERSAARAGRKEALALLARVEASCARKVTTLQERVHSYTVELAVTADASAAALAAQNAAHERALADAAHRGQERVLATRISAQRARAALRCKAFALRRWRRVATDRAHRAAMATLARDLQQRVERHNALRTSREAEHDSALAARAAQLGCALRRAALRTVVRARARRMRRRALHRASRALFRHFTAATAAFATAARIHAEAAAAAQQAESERGRRARREAQARVASALQVKRDAQRVALKRVLRARSARARRGAAVIAFQRVRAAAHARASGAPRAERFLGVALLARRGPPLAPTLSTVDAAAAHRRAEPSWWSTASRRLEKTNRRLAALERARSPQRLPAFYRLEAEESDEAEDGAANGETRRASAVGPTRAAAPAEIATTRRGTYFGSRTAPAAPVIIASARVARAARAPAPRSAPPAAERAPARPVRRQAPRRNLMPGLNVDDT